MTLVIRNRMLTLKTAMTTTLMTIGVTGVKEVNGAKGVNEAN